MVRILCSAIWYKDLPTQTDLPKGCDKGLVICGFRHSNVISATLAATGKRTVRNGRDCVGDYVQGFLTNDNRFVGRLTAAEIAFKSGQINSAKTILFSEDLW